MPPRLIVLFLLSAFCLAPACDHSEPHHRGGWRDEGKTGGGGGSGGDSPSITGLGGVPREAAACELCESASRVVVDAPSGDLVVLDQTPFDSAAARDGQELCHGMILLRHCGSSRATLIAAQSDDAASLGLGGAGGAIHPKDQALLLLKFDWWWQEPILHVAGTYRDPGGVIWHLSLAEQEMLGSYFFDPDPSIEMNLRFVASTPKADQQELLIQLSACTSYGMPCDE